MSAKKYTLRNYMAYLKDNPKGLWFKRRLYGWGWVPVSWEGWAIIVGFLAVLLINGLYFSNQVTSKGQPSSYDLAVFFGVIAVSIILVFWICYKKGERPRWSWGS